MEVSEEENEQKLEINGPKFSYLMKSITLKSQDTHQTPQKNKHKKIHTKTYYKQTTEIQRQSEKFESNKRKLTHHM